MKKYSLLTLIVLMFSLLNVIFATEINSSKNIQNKNIAQDNNINNTDTGYNSYYSYNKDKNTGENIYSTDNNENTYMNSLDNSLNKTFDNMDKNFENMMWDFENNLNKNLSEMQKQIDNMMNQFETQLNKQMEKLNNQLDKLTKEIPTQINNTLKISLDKFYKKLDTKYNDEQFLWKLDKITSKINKLKTKSAITSNKLISNVVDYVDLDIKKKKTEIAKEKTKYIKNTNTKDISKTDLEKTKKIIDKVLNEK